MALDVGSLAPDFALPDQEGNYIKLGRLLETGRATVVYFFPAADTPGCTMEACGFRDAMDEFRARGINVVGISADTQPDQAAFAGKFNLNFPLLADQGHVVCEEWGAWRGQGVGRMTFLLDEKGIVQKIYPRVDVMKHATDVLEALGGAAAPAPVPAPAAEAPAPIADLVASVARSALALLLAQLDAGAPLPEDLADLAARVAARR